MKTTESFAFGNHHIAPWRLMASPKRSHRTCLSSNKAGVLELVDRKTLAVSIRYVRHPLANYAALLLHAGFLLASIKRHLIPRIAGNNSGGFEIACEMRCIRLPDEDVADRSLGCGL